MAEQALEVELRNETEFLERYDKVLKMVDQKFDVRGSTLSSLIMLCLDNGNIVSKNRRKQFAGRVPESVFDFIEQCAKECSLSNEFGDDDPPARRSPRM